MTFSTTFESTYLPWALQEIIFYSTYVGNPWLIYSHFKTTYLITGLKTTRLTVGVQI